MNCRKAERLICAASDGALDERQRADLVAHVAECAACRRVQKQLLAVVAAWARAEHERPVPDPEREWQSVRRALRADAAPRRLFGPVTWVAVPVAAAALALGIYLVPTAKPTADPEAVPAVASAGSAGEAADSTVVYVDAKSGWTFVWSGDTGGRRG